ncbi:glycoside hydrolase family 28 protein [Catenovulum sp. SX2]|uniref:glycoside hydrolase family 28 protein n=1 Tax=Catenovulum sp. SX2 TaxID=3398614 RepID=UPI003F82872F
MENYSLTKRKLVKQIGSCALAAPFAANAVNAVNASAKSLTESTNNVANQQDAWQQAQQIIDNIQTPKIPPVAVSLAKFNPQADGTGDNTQVFANAIEYLHQKGGGKLIVPAGVYQTGPIHLQSNIELHIEKDAVISFFTDAEKYQPYVLTRWEGSDVMSYSPLIYAYKKHDIAITGQGTLQGNASADHWWPWRYKWKRGKLNLIEGESQDITRDQLRKMTADGTPIEQRVFKQNFLRPSFVQPYLCQRVLIEGVTLRNSPMWMLHPLVCSDVIVRNVQCLSFGPNSDGCDPESCRNVLIEGCVFDTADDSIAIKSGRDQDGRKHGIASENIVIRNCKMLDGDGAIAIGSEISGGVRNVFVENCFMDNPKLYRAVRIKTNSSRGGFIENIYIRNLKVNKVKDAIVINMRYNEDKIEPYITQVQNIQIENVQVVDARRAFILKGDPRLPLKQVKLQSIEVKKIRKEDIIQDVAELTQDKIIVAGKNRQLGQIRRVQLK